MLIGSLDPGVLWLLTVLDTSHLFPSTRAMESGSNARKGKVAHVISYLSRDGEGL